MRKCNFIITFFLSTCLIYSQENNLLQSVGKIGIGTLSPSVKLDVKGRVNVDSLLQVNGGLNLRGLGSTDLLNGTDKVLLIDGNGNVKVGQIPLIDIGEGGIGIQVQPCRYNLQGQVTQPVWWSGVNKLYSPCSTVNVGINNSNPRVKLDVFGEIYGGKIALGNANPTQLGKKYFHLKIPSNLATVETDFFVVEDDNYKLLTISNTGLLKAKGYGGPFKLYGNFSMNTNLDQSNNSNVFTISNNNSKLLQLNNQGQLYSRGITVNLQAWPDYVFEKDYKLMPLSEVESFILQHKHLPSIPSEQEILEKGNDLGEMDQLLLQKIEELTLYIIEQQKQIDALKIQIEKDK